MNLWRLSTRTLVYYRAAYGATAAGAAVACAVLVGALGAGDSIRASLARLRDRRLGRVEWAVRTGDRYFGNDLDTRLSARWDSGVAAVLRLDGAVSNGDETRRANRVQVLGVDERFWGMGKTDAIPPAMQSGEVWINARVSKELGLAAGQDIVVQVRRPTDMSPEFGLTSDRRLAQGMRLKVAGIVDDGLLGAFNLDANHVAPLNVYALDSWLGESVGLGPRANVLLVAGGARKADRLAERLRGSLTLADLGVRIETRPDGTGSVTSDGFFLSPAVEAAVLAADPLAVGVSCLLVDALVAGERSSPYAFVGATGMLARMSGDEAPGVVISQWLADDLQAGAGDTVTVRYFTPDSGRILRTAERTFPVASVVSMAEAAGCLDMAPDLPGLTDVRDCREWDSGIPLDLSRIRPVDEAYWRSHGATPKAWLPLEAVAPLWRRPEGLLTAVWMSGRETRGMEEAILTHIDLARAGFVVENVAERGRRGSEEAVDFGQLFLGMSLFLIAAALGLTALMFGLAADSRTEEAGLLAALGFTTRGRRRLQATEAALVAGAGAVPGAFGGAAFTYAIVWGLRNLWRGAVGTDDLVASISSASVLAGVAASMAAAWIGMLACSSLAAEAPARLLQGREQEPAGRSGSRRGWPLWVGCGLMAVALIPAAALRLADHSEAAGLFFGAGALLLGGALLVWMAVLRSLGGRNSGRAIGLLAAGIRNAGRRPGRSLAVVGVLATGLFLVVAVGAHRPPGAGAWWEREGGTGGFGLVGESSIPIPYDLRRQDARDRAGLHGSLWDGVAFVGIRANEGDDASCLNLNRSQRPRVLGVPAGELAGREAFSFAHAGSGSKGGNPWLLLDQPLDDGAIPAMADETVLRWGLGKAVGDEIPYAAGDGSPVRLRVVASLRNSVLQGNLLISEREFERLFPGGGGRRLFLVDTPVERREAVQGELTRVFREFGLALARTESRLAEFAAVEHAYLTIFMSLGGLGLLLATVAFGIVVVRNVLERRGEMALLRALGYHRSQVWRMVVGEHVFLAIGGMVTGCGAGLLAVLPASIGRDGGEIPWMGGGVLLGLILVSACLWTFAAAWVAWKRDIVAGLREE